jgi:hypothetical protein
MLTPGLRLREGSVEDLDLKKMIYTIEGLKLIIHLIRHLCK